VLPVSKPCSMGASSLVPAEIPAAPPLGISHPIGGLWWAIALHRPCRQQPSATVRSALPWLSAVAQQPKQTWRSPPYTAGGLPRDWMTSGLGTSAWFDSSATVLLGAALIGLSLIKLQSQPITGSQTVAVSLNQLRRAASRGSVYAVLESSSNRRAAPPHGSCCSTGQCPAAFSICQMGLPGRCAWRRDAEPW